MAAGGRESCNATRLNLHRLDILDLFDDVSIGRIVTADTGTPVRRALVRLFSTEDREGRAVATDGEGRYEFKDLPSGRYELNATKGGFVNWAYGQRRASERGKQIDLTDGQTLTKIDISMPRGG